MSPSKPSRIATLLAGAVAFGLLLSVAIAAYFSHRSELDAAELNGIALDEKFQRHIERATTLRIWAAGYRYPTGGGFCGCAGVTPTMIYETSQPAEIREFGSRLRHRRTPTGPAVAVCSPVTIDLVRDNETLHSFNYKPYYLADESGSQLNGWLERRQVWSKVEVATADYVSKASKK